MKRRNFFHAGSRDRLDGAGAGCHEKYFVPAAGRRGDVFLDSPFQRTLGDFALPNVKPGPGFVRNADYV